MGFRKYPEASPFIKHKIGVQQRFTDTQEDTTRGFPETTQSGFYHQTQNQTVRNK